MEKIKRHLLPIVTALSLLLCLAVLDAAENESRAAFAEAATQTTVIVDPGHGGADGGAVSPDGLAEAGVNLDISLRLRDLLRLCGVPVVMTRETDTMLSDAGCKTISEKKVSDLHHRAELVNAQPDGLLVSIHQNKFEQSKYRGAQVFYAGTADSDELASAVQESLRLSLDPGNRRACKPSQSVYLMEHIRCTGILVECGFLSNPDECALLQTPSYQQKLSAAVCGAVTEYLAKRGTEDEI